MLTNLQMALKALTQNRLQALLTLCGMSVGVAMVVIVSGLGRGAQLSIERQIESAGPTLITLRAGNFRPAGIVTSGQQDSSGGEPAEGIAGGEDVWDPTALQNEAIASVRERALKPRMDKHRSPAWPLGPDERRLLDGFADVRAVAAQVAGNLTLDPDADLPVRIAHVEGFEPAWPEMQGWTLKEGRLPSAREHSEGVPVALVSEAAAARLWPQASPLGRHVKVRDAALRVVGVVGGSRGDAGSVIVPSVHVPLTLAQKLLGRETYDVIHVRSRSVATTTRLATELKAALRELRQLPEDTLDDFRVETQSTSALPSLGTDPRLARAVHSNIVEFELASWEEMASSLRQAGRTFTLLLAGAAAVSLLVGGIGIMNIMLVSVAARTREIGLRMALGARMGDVMAQFMVEAVALAALGGVIGLLLGAAGLYLARHGLQWATAVSPAMLAAAVAMAAVTGVLFGYGPARRAAGLDPVVALKSE